MQVKIKRLDKNAVIPKFATAGAACMDVVATSVTYNKDYSCVTYGLGFSTEIPEGYKACFAPRSSFTHKGWVMANNVAQIDSDYRGEWMVKFEAIPNGYVPKLDLPNFSLPEKMLYPHGPYKVGERIAQMWLDKIVKFEFLEVEELESTERGEGGFGSTGK